MPPRFGTDGLRGVANVELTVELAQCLGRVAARTLGTSNFVLGRDTRQSSPMLAAALASGLASEGASVIDVGVLPTPGIAYLCASIGAPGAVISASHNPYADNGIKLISDVGTKLPDEAERHIEVELDALSADPGHVESRPHGNLVGTISAGSELVDSYVDHLIASIDAPRRRLFVVCDCANGAASSVAKRVFSGAGVDVEVICDEPDGTNINENCGSTHPKRLADAVRSKGADLGLAFDGDADRLIAVANDGTIVDGDVLIALFAMDLRSRGLLAKDGVVVTVMSNLGLRKRLEAEGLSVVETPVGDRYVSDALVSKGFVLGGEQSGHLVFRRDATTGDGMLTGLKLVELVARAQRPLSELATQAMTRLPQELRSVAVAAPHLLEQAAKLWAAVERYEHELGSSGRVLLRRSGTEPVVRVMVEAESEQLATTIVEDLARLITDELGPSVAAQAMASQVAP